MPNIKKWEFQKQRKPYNAFQRVDTAKCYVFHYYSTWYRRSTSWPLYSLAGIFESALRLLSVTGFYLWFLTFRVRPVWFCSTQQIEIPCVANKQNMHFCPSKWREEHHWDEGDKDLPIHPHLSPQRKRKMPSLPFLSERPTFCKPHVLRSLCYLQLVHCSTCPHAACAWRSNVLLATRTQLQ